MPEGGALPAEVWAYRHRALLWVLWAHVPVLFLYAMVAGATPLHAALEVGAVAALATVAAVRRRHRTVATLATSLGLLTCSAVLVHASGGLIEMHFHYFVMVGLVALYQDWTPYLTAITYVVVQHGLAGLIDPGDVYSHVAGVEQPLRWAAVHGGFILAMSAAGVASWRFNEHLLRTSVHRAEQLAEAERLARLGSWQLDLMTGELTWSDELYRVLGLEPGERPATVETLLDLVHPDDLAAVRHDLARIVRGVPVARDYRAVLPSGALRWVSAQGEAVGHEDGRPSLYTGTLQDITARKKAEEQAAALSLLSSTLESTADGILVVDLHGRVTTFNQRFLDLWHVPAEVLAGGPDESALFELAAAQVADPDAFRQRVEELYGGKDARSLDIVELADGRVFERYSQPQRIGSEVVGRVWSFRDITDQARMERELAHQAFHDSLTGLANRALFSDRIRHALARRTSAEPSVGVLYVDVDGFKAVNDSIGHAAGDALLVAIAGRITRALGPGDTAARLGGDEFAVLVEGLDGTGRVVALAERLVSAMGPPFAIGGRQLAVRASVGIAMDVDGMTADQLLANADVAMYHAKRTGKGGVQVFSPEMRAALVSRRELEGDLRQALRQGALAVHYQPIVDRSGGPHGVEALVRWDHPVRGPLPPSEFIPIAEESGLIAELGHHVLRSACAQVRRWHRSHPHLVLSVNLSPFQVESDGIVAEVAGILADTGLPASKLVLELTEGALMSDSGATLERLEALKALGIRLAIDDFGTGYSSLSRLQRLPVDVLKIDRAFIQRADVDPQSRSLVESIVAMAASLGLEAVAEGVETAEQQAVVSASGCALAQGFHHARPMDAAAMEDFLAWWTDAPGDQWTVAATSA